MRFLYCALMVGLLAVPAVGQPWYAKGTFNGWGTGNEMTVDPMDSTHYTAQITGLFASDPHKFKIATADWSINMPSSDARVFADASGNINFHLYDQTTWSDGWFPNNQRRVGYDDHQYHDWEIVGSFNGWPGDAFDPNFALTDMGNGLHRGTFTFDSGVYDFKFRGLVPQNPDPPQPLPENGVWDTSIGNSFGNNAGNNTFLVQNDGDAWVFELDLPKGRFRFFAEEQSGVDGDHNEDGQVNAADYVFWRKTDAGNAAGYTEWRTNYGTGTELSWIARSTDAGDDWSAELVDQGEGLFTVTRSGLTPGSDHQVQVIRSDLSTIVPGSAVKIRADASGEINMNFYELTELGWEDGWQPNNEHRIGYEDHEQFDWQIVGTFQEPDWPGTNDPAYFLIDQGNGLHTGSFTFTEPGTYDFKFRQQDDTNPWNTSIGNNFGNNAGNNQFTVTTAGEVWNFELDLPNGRWRAYLGTGTGSAVPEPASFVLMLLSGVMLSGLRRRG